MLGCDVEVAMSNNKVVVAMSGGVDSSVAALLLKQQGYDVVGVTMKLYSLPQGDLPASYRGCCAIDDVEDARRVCDRLGVPHYVLNVQQEFQAHVIDYFCAEYQQGRTPHPCIACNDKIKFNFLAGRARVLQADYLATGHYARIQASPQGWLLKKAADASKDQSYVLFGLGQQELGRSLLPVGDYPKDEVRRMAREHDFPNAGKPDSQDICFIPFGDYRQFLQARSKPVPGEIADVQGNVLGTHQGVEYFTVGQRRGLGLAKGDPLYVLRVEPETRRVVVGPESALFHTQLWAGRVSYTLGQPPAGPVEVGVKIRYKSSEAAAVLHPRPQGALLSFSQPQRAITPGQAAVFYQGDVVLGGGIIEGTLPPD